MRYVPTLLRVAAEVGADIAALRARVADRAGGTETPGASG
jgi:hypothetical protein